MTFDELIAASQAPKLLDRFIDCYKSAQTDGLIALQSELSMRNLAPILPNLTLLEATRSDMITYRLAGQEIVDTLGFNPVGQNFLDFLDPGLRATSAAGHDLMQEHPCGYYMVYENVYESGHRKVMETLTLPLRKSLDHKNRLFLSCHIEHHLSEISATRGETAMVVTWKTNVFANIGGGEPAVDLMDNVQQSFEPATAV